MAFTALQDPMLVIIGATGTGKSKLAVELATRFNGEIINGDAMQMYKGLPIITNKILDTERNGISHHLIDFIGLDEEPWTVSRFVNEAQRVMREIRGRGRLPILVGGTHYYTQSLLFKDSLIVDRVDENGRDTEKTEEEWPILEASTDEIYAKLEELDPVMARRWHPKDRRKIRRSLEICLQTGRRASEVYQEQEDQKGRSSSDRGGGPENGAKPIERLRYPSAIFWLHAQEEILKARLNRRVDTMVESGLLEEACNMSKYHTEHASKDSPLDLDRGIWVSIGYKELQPYIAALRSGNWNPKELIRIRDECIEAVKASTRQYAKKQNRWIRLTLADLLAKASSLDKLFLMDCTDPERWMEMVSRPSEQTAEAFLRNDCLPEPSSLSSLAESILASSGRGSGKQEFQARRCSTCQKVLMSEIEWIVHLKSSGHKRVIESQRKRAENERRRLVVAAARLEAASSGVPLDDGSAPPS